MTERAPGTPDEIRLYNLLNPSQVPAGEDDGRADAHSAPVPSPATRKAPATDGVGWRLWAVLIVALAVLFASYVLASAVDSMGELHQADTARLEGSR